MIEELKELVQTHGLNEVKAYFKVKDGCKVYYDYQLESYEAALNGSYDLLAVEELLYYLKEQADGV